MHLASCIDTKHQFLSGQWVYEPVVDIIFALCQWLIGNLNFLLLFFPDPDSFQIMFCLYIFF